MIEKPTYRFIAHPGALEELEGKWVAAKLYDIIMLHDKEEKE